MSTTISYDHLFKSWAATRAQVMALAGELAHIARRSTTDHATHIMRVRSRGGQEWVELTDLLDLSENAWRQITNLWLHVDSAAIELDLFVWPGNAVKLSYSGRIPPLRGSDELEAIKLSIEHAVGSYERDQETISRLPASVREQLSHVELLPDNGRSEWDEALDRAAELERRLLSDERLRHRLGLGETDGETISVDAERIVQLVMGDQYTVGQAGAVGPGSAAQNMTFAQTWNQVSGGNDSQALASELATLVERLRSTRSEPEHDIVIGVLTEAQIEAQEGSGPAAIERLSRLKRFGAAGKWALGTATAIGTGIAAAALKSVLGL